MLMVCLCRNSFVFVLGESQLATSYPGMTRGLQAVLLYQDGRRALVTSLRLLVQARKGRHFSIELSVGLQSFISDYTDQLVTDGLVTKILGELSILSHRVVLHSYGPHKLPNVFN